MTPSSFAGPVADSYAQFRRGYPPPVLDRLAAALGLDERSRVLDLGCGTGQLTVPLAARSRSVLGVDIEADMLRLARHAGHAAGARNITWMLGADSDLDALVPFMGEQMLDAVTIGQALHWMDPPRLFRTLRQLVRPGGGVAVIANGTPLWLQETSWSRALRRHLETWLGTELTARCGTDSEARQRYRAELVAAGFDDTTDVAVEYTENLTFEQVVGNVYSAMTPDQLPWGDERARFEGQLRAALAGETVAEHVPVTILTGRSTGHPG